MKINRTWTFQYRALIKIASHLLCKPFVKIYNESISTEIVPEIFKISKVTPVSYKSGVTTESGNYRPTAIISPFSKVLERLIYTTKFLPFSKKKRYFLIISLVLEKDIQLITCNSRNYWKLENSNRWKQNNLRNLSRFLESFWHH
jgi:hypothetical protein